jgi:hypothetical protein
VSNSGVATFQCQVEATLFASLEGACRGVIVSLREGQGMAEQARTLGATTEYALCQAFRSIADTAAYWVDGVEVGRIEFVSPTRVQAQGLAWCADDRNQWKVPVQIHIDVGEAQPPAILKFEVQLGDAAFADLRGHVGWSPTKAGDLRQWLYTLVLQAKGAFSALPEALAALEKQLRDWVALNPGRPMVGLDWQPLTAEQALQFIREHGGQQPVTLEETWLDGGAALLVRLARASAGSHSAVINPSR